MYIPVQLPPSFSCWLLSGGGASPRARADELSRWPPSDAAVWHVLVPAGMWWGGEGGGGERRERRGKMGGEGEGGKGRSGRGGCGEREREGEEEGERVKEREKGKRGEGEEEEGERVNSLSLFRCINQDGRTSLFSKSEFEVRALSLSTAMALRTLSTIPTTLFNICAEREGGRVGGGGGGGGDGRR